MSSPPALDHWLEKLRRQPLPTLGQSRTAVTKLLDSPTTRHAVLEQAITLDPGLTVALFTSFANQVKQPREPTCTVAHAIALLGLAPLYDAVANLPVADDDNPAWQRGLADCYARAAHAARYAFHWGVSRGDPAPEELATAALLHHCAEMALWCAAPDQMAKLQPLAPGAARDRVARERLGGTLDELGRALASAWFLPPLVAASLQPLGAFQSRSLGVMLAVALARESASGWYRENTVELVELAAEYLSLEADSGTAHTHALCAEIARELAPLALRTSAAGLLLPLPGGLTKPPSSLTARPDAPPAGSGRSPPPLIDPDQAATAAPAQRPPTDTPAAAPAPPPVKVTQATTPAPVRSALPRALSNAQLQLPLSETLRAMQRELGLERCLFAMVTSDRRQVRARFVLGAPKESPLREFRLPLAERNLFSLLMTKPQGFWLNDGNRDKFRPLIPPALRAMVSCDTFFASSLFLRGQPLGLFYADAKTLDGEAFNAFKTLVQRLSKTLTEIG